MTALLPWQKTLQREINKEFGSVPLSFEGNDTGALLFVCSHAYPGFYINQNLYLDRNFDKYFCSENHGNIGPVQNGMWINILDKLTAQIRESKQLNAPCVLHMPMVADL